VERDIGEKVFSGARDPSFGDEATVPERVLCVVYVVDDVIQEFCWEVGVRHRGSWLLAERCGAHSDRHQRLGLSPSLAGHILPLHIKR
jgi:hypothetical protein